MAKTVEETAKPTNDAYTGMLAISLIALLIGCALLYLDLNQYDWKKEPPKVTPPPGKAAPLDPGKTS
jgi:hypothetical protein